MTYYPKFKKQYRHHHNSHVVKGSGASSTTIIITPVTTVILPPTTYKYSKRFHTFLMVKNINASLLPRHKSITRTSTTNPLNVYKAEKERKGASFKIILFLAATTCYTAFLYSGARGLSIMTHIHMNMNMDSLFCLIMMLKALLY